MEQEGPSFWADIKKYEDTLEKDPNSYCFAPLSELYRKLGMVDDAINIAKRGCEIHPDYVGGYMALGRAYFEKGMSAESKEALRKVVRVTPENLLAQRILSKIYMDEGDASSAEASLRAILAHNPDDSESRMLLDSLKMSSSSIEQTMPKSDEDGYVIGDLENIGAKDDFSPLEEFADVIDLDGCEIIEEITDEDFSEVPEEENSELEFDLPEMKAKDEGELSVAGERDEKDPLTTATLAELYVSQGYPKKALQIFRELLDADPENSELISRIHTLKQEIDEDEESARSQSQEPELPVKENFEPVMEQSGEFSTREFLIYPHEEPGQEPIPEPCFDGFDSDRNDIPCPEIPAEEPGQTQASELPASAEIDPMLTAQDETGNVESHSAMSDENIIRNLEILLENIKRRR